VFQERRSGDSIRFYNLLTITDHEIKKLPIAINTKVLKHLRKRSHSHEHGEMVNHLLADLLFTDHESIAMATASPLWEESLLDQILDKK
jgi:hypothetical protein